MGSSEIKHSLKNIIESIQGESWDEENIDNVNMTYALHLRLLSMGIKSEILQGWRIDKECRGRAVLYIKTEQSKKSYYILLFEGIHVNYNSNIVLKHRPSNGQIERCRKNKTRHV